MNKSTLSKSETINALDQITEMTDKEIDINHEWIRIVAQSALCHVKRK